MFDRRDHINSVDHNQSQHGSSRDRGSPIPPPEGSQNRGNPSLPPLNLETSRNRGCGGANPGGGSHGGGGGSDLRNVINSRRGYNACSTNAPATFECLMKHVLQPFWRKVILVFLDDIFTYSSTIEDHVQHVKLVLEQLRLHQWYLKLSKCPFAQAQIEYLGHIISREDVATDPTKTKAMLK
jgi:hypothetical protein